MVHDSPFIHRQRSCGISSRALARFQFAVSAATLSINGCSRFTFEADGSITCVTSPRLPAVPPVRPPAAP